MRTTATKPILFSEPMVRAILDGRKTMTRRLPDKQRRRAWEGYQQSIALRRGMNPPKLPLYVYDEKEFYEIYPPYRPGDLLWVRETWANALLNGGPDGFSDTFAYKADGSVRYGSRKAEDLPPNAISAWQSSIFMPKAAARLFLRVKNVRMERVQDISAADAVKEGCAGEEDFRRLWDSLLKHADRAKCGWDANPWVWAIAFERVPKPKSWPETGDES